MEGVLESTVRKGDESMMKVPEITLRYIDDVEDFTPFVDWMHRHMKGWNHTSKNANCFVCARCHKEIPLTDGGANLSFKVEDNGWTLYAERIGSSNELAICLPCMREVLLSYGMKPEKIETLCKSFNPQYVQGEYVVVERSKKGSK